MALNYVRGELLAPEICMKAVIRCGRAFEYVLVELLTFEICVEAVKHNVHSSECVKTI
jgi:hypothetical protein